VLPLIARRILATIPVMGVVALTVFGLLHLTPGDPAVIIAGDYATTQDIDKIRTRLGLDRPLLTQAGIWLASVARGDLGVSIYSGLPVTRLIGQRVGPTAALTALAMLISVTLAVPLGVLAAWRQGSWLDRAIMILSVSGFSMPVFWLGFLLVWVFAIQAGVLPVQGYQPLDAGPWQFLRHLVLPAVTLSLVYMALIARMTRASVLGVLREDYIRTAFAKGLAPHRVLLGHALKAASLPAGSVIVSFVLRHDGYLMRISEIESPQGEQFVRAAEEALKQVGFFAPFPEGSPASEVRFRLAVEYVP